MKIPASCKQIYARVFRSVLLQHCLSRGVFTSEFGRIGSPALAAMGGGAEAVPPFFCSESSGGRRGPGPGCVHAPVQQQSCKSHHRSWRTSRRVCGSSDTASHLSPPPSPPPSRLDICVASDRIPSLFGVQTSTDHGSIPWGTYNLSHDVCLPLALQGPSAHALAPSFCLACGRGVMPQDAGVVARAGFPSAARRCVAWWGCGGDEMTLLTWSWSWLARTTQTTATLEGMEPQTNFTMGVCGFPSSQTGDVWLLAWGVWGREAIGYVGRFSCPCKYAPEWCRVSALVPSCKSLTWLGAAIQAAAKSPRQKLLVFLAERKVP